MNSRRRSSQRGNVAVMFLGVLGGLVAVIEAGSLGGSIVQAHLRAHSEAESLALVAAQDIDESVYHTTGRVVLDTPTARDDAEQAALTLPVRVEVVDVEPQHDPVLGDSVRVTVRLSQALVGSAPVTVPIYESAAARLERR